MCSCSGEFVEVEIGSGADSVNFQGLRSLKSGYRVAENGVSIQDSAHCAAVTHVNLRNPLIVASLTSITESTRPC